ncbi:ergothioneine biosynthesis protein EgtB [Catenovulum adriaticum]|uniref:Ergothioneine biosynthesis protein EgtB n=1 Tax=Catenovulum adriaticum TaxID=2984846 RepID=A0ABY7AHF9_9ALTE|nr:ergothioneine biosynthesis protein EgtB [Catenovulum sp. TS8]WAJ69052.1 ergothioneine biosynthesis protein EgtB [Catenovulum sp. TS8]
MNNANPQSNVILLIEQFTQCRTQTVHLTKTLSDEDMLLQSMEDASPTKWHLAHTSWFFEQFILMEYVDNYKPFDPHFNYLFNSYYNQLGERHTRAQRGLLSRPSLSQVFKYREYVNEAITKLLVKPNIAYRVVELVELGVHHEMQHQELILTDILHALSCNPLYPSMRTVTPVINSDDTQTAETNKKPLLANNGAETRFSQFEGGLYQIGAQENVFSFDCERPKHLVYLENFELANTPVTNRQWLEFMQDGGYQTPTLWLSDGWTQVQQQNWQAPLYWVKKAGRWFSFGLDGLQALSLDAPVCHISYFEADAFANWANARLPTEFEWEVAAKQLNIEGNFQRQNHWRPQMSDKHKPNLQQMYGDVWEWTSSPYIAYPKFEVASGAVGEYNGKFMCGQFVLRGGSCVTPIEQIRHSYRNFFYPAQRWQFSGLRLARNI